jgi:hypothetical protein
MKHRHTPVPLYEKPPPNCVQARVEYLFIPTRYVLCTTCNRVGLIARYGRRIIWQPEDEWADKHRRKAAEWKDRLHELVNG